MPAQFLGRREMGEEHILRGWGRVGGLREKGEFIGGSGMCEP